MPVVTADGSGYSHTPLKPESEAYLINNDRPAYKAIKGNNGTCAKHAGCLK